LLAEARFLLARALGLAHRALASLRTRGWRASWSRALRQWSPARLPPSALYRPADAAFTPFAVPFSATPRASIVIPVYGQCAHTLACLRAIAAHPPAAPIDVIIVDDGSIDDTAQLLPRVDGLRYHRRAANGGFIAASNDGAALARGGFLVFLNNDTVPQPGWLDALLDTFAGQAGAGLVGAQLLYPDGRLQEAGGVVFSDGSAWNYGRFGDPSDPRYGYVRDADYLSAAAVAIPRDLFERLGGFDTRYAPAYYEDTDLAFAVRAAGLRTLYQPRARVLHDEGTSAGTDPRQGMKAAQVRNREVFAAKWAAALPSRLPPGSEPTPALLHRGQKQVLVIDALAPQPDRDSGSLRLVNLMRLLRGEGAHVVFLPANREHGGRYTEALQQLGVEAWYAPHARRAPGWLREHGHRFHSVLACRHYVAREFLPLLRAHAPQARVVFDSVDLHYLRERRAAELRGGAAQRRAALRTRALELGVIAASDATLVVSEAERALLATDAPSARVEVLSGTCTKSPARQAVRGAQGTGVRRRIPPPAERRRRALVRSVVSRSCARACPGSLPLHRWRRPPTLPPRAQEGVGYMVCSAIEPWMTVAGSRYAPLRYGAGVRARSTSAWRTGNRWWRRPPPWKACTCATAKTCWSAPTPRPLPTRSCGCMATRPCGNSSPRVGLPMSPGISRWMRRGRPSGACCCSVSQRDARSRPRPGLRACRAAATGGRSRRPAASAAGARCRRARRCGCRARARLPARSGWSRP